MKSKEKYQKRESDNYIFYYLPNSLAEKEIEKIIEIQEECFTEVCEILHHKTNMKIDFYLFNDPKSCGISYDINTNPENAPLINAFCYYPNNVHATYSERIKAIGKHEIAHLLLFEKLNIEPNLMLNEGFAVNCDGYWLRYDLYKWVNYIIEINLIDTMKALQDANYFLEHNTFSYAIVGAYCKWKINKDGKDSYFNLLKVSCDNKNFVIPEIEEFIDFIRTVELSNKDIEFLQEQVKICRENN